MKWLEYRPSWGYYGKGHSVSLSPNDLIGESWGITAGFGAKPRENTGIPRQSGEDINGFGLIKIHIKQLFNV